MMSREKQIAANASVWAAEHGASSSVDRDEPEGGANAGHRFRIHGRLGEEELPEQLGSDRPPGGQDAGEQLRVRAGAGHRDRSRRRAHRGRPRHGGAVGDGGRRRRTAPARGAGRPVDGRKAGREPAPPTQPVAPPMRFRVLAADYDGTLAHHGRVAPSTVAALRRLKDSGRKLVLVTGRRARRPARDLPRDRPVRPGRGRERRRRLSPRHQGEPGPGRAAPAGVRRTAPGTRIPDVAVGQVIVATWQPHEVTVLELIKEMGLELQVIFNKGAVMVLPSGVNKASGLPTALDELGLSPRNTVAVGDAENDHAFLSALRVQRGGGQRPARGQAARRPGHRRRPRGRRRGADRPVAGRRSAPRWNQLERHAIPLGAGTTPGGSVRGSPVPGCPSCSRAARAAGKSSLATAFIETLSERGYQCCIIDPEGDMRDLPVDRRAGRRRARPRRGRGSRAAGAAVEIRTWRSRSWACRSPTGPRLLRVAAAAAAGAARPHRATPLDRGRRDPPRGARATGTRAVSACPPSPTVCSSSPCTPATSRRRCSPRSPPP